MLNMLEEILKKTYKTIVHFNIVSNQSIIFGTKAHVYKRPTKYEKKAKQPNAMGHI